MGICPGEDILGTREARSRLQDLHFVRRGTCEGYLPRQGDVHNRAHRQSDAAKPIPFRFEDDLAMLYEDDNAKVYESYPPGSVFGFEGCVTAGPQRQAGLQVRCRPGSLPCLLYVLRQAALAEVRRA